MLSDGKSLTTTSLFLFADEWLMFDDDNVNPVSSEDVRRLSGGGWCLLSSYTMCTDGEQQLN